MTKSFMQESLGICFKIWSVYGLTPISFASQKCKLNSKLVFTVMFILFLPSLRAYLLLSKARPRNTVVISTITTLGVVAGCVVTFLIYKFTLAKRHEIVQFCNEVLVFDETLKCSKASLKCGSKFKIVSRMYISVVMIMPWIISVVRNQLTDFKWTEFVSLIEIHLTTAIVQYYLSLYVLWVVTFCVRFRALNDYFRHKYKVFSKIEGLSLTNVSTIVHVHSKFQLTKIHHEEILHVIDTLSCLYHKLWLLTDKFNDLFSPGIIFAMISFAPWTIIHMHFFVYYLVGRGKGKWLHSLCTFSLNVTQVSILIYVCVMAKDEAMKTRKLLYNLKTLSKNMTIKVSQFSLMLYQEKVCFSAFKIFNFDGHFLVSIAATMCTVVVIMLQFDEALSNLGQNT